MLTIKEKLSYISYISVEVQCTVHEHQIINYVHSWEWEDSWRLHIPVLSSRECSVCPSLPEWPELASGLGHFLVWSPSSPWSRLLYLLYLAEEDQRLLLALFPMCRLSMLVWVSPPPLQLRQKWEQYSWVWGRPVQTVSLCSCCYINLTKMFMFAPVSSQLN